MSGDIKKERDRLGRLVRELWVGWAEQRDKAIKERDSAEDDANKSIRALTRELASVVKQRGSLQDEAMKERKQHVELIDDYNRQIATITTMQEALRRAENTLKEKSVQERIYTTGIEALTRANVELTDKLYIADTQLSTLREDLLKEGEEKRQLQLILSQLVEKLTVISKSFR